MSIPDIKASDIMKEPVTIDSNATVLEAVMKIINTGVGSLIVVSNNKPIGIVTKRDLLWSIIYSGRKPSETKVCEIMTKQLITITPDTSVVDIVNIMLSNNISHLPVVENNELLGVVSDRDIVEVVNEFIDMIKWYRERIAEASE